MSKNICMGAAPLTYYYGVTEQLLLRAFSPENMGTLNFVFFMQKRTYFEGQVHDQVVAYIFTLSLYPFSFHL